MLVVVTTLEGGKEGEMELFRALSPLSLYFLWQSFSRAFVKILRVCCAWKYIERCCRDIKINTRSRLVSVQTRVGAIFDSVSRKYVRNTEKIVENSRGLSDESIPITIVDFNF